MKMFQLMILWAMSLASLTVGLESEHYRLDKIRQDSSTTFTFSERFLRYAQLGSMLSTKREANAFFKKYLVFDQVETAIFSEGLPQIISMNISPNWVIPGDMVTVDIVLSEKVRDFAVLVDEVRQVNAVLDDQNHLIFAFQAMYPRTKQFDMQINLVDMTYHVGQWQNPFTLYIDNGENNLIQKLLSTEMVSEVHQGKLGARELVFELSVVQMESWLQAITVNLSTQEGQTPFSQVRLREASSDLVIAESSQVQYNQPFLLELASANTLTTIPNKYYLEMDVKETAPLGLTFNVSIPLIRTRLKEARAVPVEITGNLSSGLMTIVAKDKPIVMKAQTEEFIAQDKSITVNIEQEILKGEVTQISYNVYDLTSENCVVAQGVTDISGLQSETVIRQNSARSISTLYNHLIKSNLVHNHQYHVSLELIGPMKSLMNTTNILKVDMTPPCKPNPVRVQAFTEYRSQARAKDVRISTENSAVSMKLLADVYPWLDPESGLKSYRILRKSNQEPSWKSIITGNVLSQDVLVLNHEEKNNRLYHFAVSVQNKAGVWSEPSVPREVDLRSGVALVDTLFNSPNPFDSRKESTTIYYTLRDNSTVELYLYDMFGYLIRSWVFPAGSPGGQKSNSLIWDGTNAFGTRVSKGAYILVLNATDQNGLMMRKKYAIGLIR